MDSSSSDDETLQKCANSDAKTGMDNLPAKSREKYLKCYDMFTEWKTSKGFKNFSEAVILAYFQELSKTRQASTLWVTYSMLRATISANDNVNINTYSKLLSFLKSMSKGHVSKKSKVFTAQDVENFLRDAPDDVYLAMKVGLIFGISGACRASELVKIRTEDVKKHSDQALIVNLMKSPTEIERSFVIRDEYVKLVEKYQALRPPDMELNRFFVFYQNGKCTRQAIGKHKICEFPKKIAKFLNLPNAGMYTGHCLRRTSASLLVQSGADAVMLRQCGGWKSHNGIVEYLEHSYTKRVRVDAPRIPPPPTDTEALQSESSLAETQQCEALLSQSQQNYCQQAQTQQCESLLAQSQQYHSQLAQTQQCESLLAQSQQSHSQQAQTQQCELLLAQSQQSHSQQAQSQQCESLLTQSQQYHSQLAQTQQCEFLLAQSQQCHSRLAQTQPCEFLLAQSQQCHSRLAQTQPCEFLLAQSQQCHSRLAQTQQCDTLLTQTQQCHSRLAQTQQCDTLLTQTQQCYPQLTPQCESCLADNNQPDPTQWIEIDNTKQVKTQQCEETQTEETVTIKIQQCESLADDTQSHWSESPFDESQSMKTDDPFDPIPEEYAASAAVNAARGAARRAGARARLAALRRRRLRLAELRARQLHARETQRLRVEARRLEVDAERSKALRRIADVAMAWLDYASPP